MPAVFAFQTYVYGPKRGAFEVTMETMAERFAALEGLFFEWDGSFTWASQTDGWQIDGTVYDNGQTIQYVDLHGRATSPAGRQAMADRLLQIFEVLDRNGEVALMRLPAQTWQDLQGFEKELRAESIADR